MYQLSKMFTFSDDVVDEAHRETKYNKISKMIHELVEAVHNVLLFAFVALIEGHFFAVRDQASVHVTEFTFVSLFAHSLVFFKNKKD